MKIISLANGLSFIVVDRWQDAEIGQCVEGCPVCQPLKYYWDTTITNEIPQTELDSPISVYFTVIKKKWERVKLSTGDIWQRVT